MKQRIKQPVVTRQLILDAAGNAFSQHGYSGAGLGNIVRDAGLTKGALFHHFPDKRALAISWIHDDLMISIRSCWVTPLDEIQSLNGLRAFCRTRCLELVSGDVTSTLVSLAAETAATDSLLGAAFEEIFVAWRTAISELLNRGKSNGWIHSSIQPDVESGILVSMFSGLSVTTKCNLTENFRRACATGVEAYLETLRPQ